MIACMSTPAPRSAAGSVGTVDTQFIDLPAPLRLDCGRELPSVRVAYETYGTLSPARDNVILVCHALSGDAHAAGFSRQPAAGSTRDGFRADERDAGCEAADETDEHVLDRCGTEILGRENLRMIGVE